MSEFVCFRRDICAQIISGKSTSDIEKYLLDSFHLSTTEVNTVIQSIQRNLITICNQKWVKAQKKQDRFESQNTNWLNGEFKVLLPSCSTSTSKSSDLNTSGDRGRPTKTYEACSESTRKRKNMELLQEYGMGHVHYAYVQGLRSMSENDEASIVSIIRNTEKEEKKVILGNILRSPDGVPSYTKEEALCIDEELIKRLYIILQTMSSGFSVNAVKFGEYTFGTAQLYVSKYYWYYMPSSVHKILIHGAKIIEHFAVLPIGQLSEDAQEARNKDYKRYRLNHARKCSRSATMEDVLHILLYTSDPYISSLNRSSTMIPKELFNEAKELLALTSDE